MADFYPQPLAGQTITAALLRSMLPQIARKTGDETRTSTTTTTLDEHMFFTVEANAVYSWNGFLKYTADTAGDLVIDFTIPSGALGEWGGFGAGITPVSANGTPTLQNNTQSSSGYMLRAETNDVSQARTYGGLGTSVGLTVIIFGMLRVGSTGGTWGLEWAQGTSSATATTLYTDSYIALQRIA